jgi:hypothetical protein
MVDASHLLGGGCIGGDENAGAEQGGATDWFKLLLQKEFEGPFGRVSIDDLPKSRSPFGFVSMEALPYSRSMGAARSIGPFGIVLST